MLVEGRRNEAVERVEREGQRSAEDDYARLRLRHCLADTLFAAGQFQRAAPVLVEVGREYRRFLGPVNALSLDCDHDGGLAYAELGDPEDALPLLRRFVEHAEPDDERADDACAVLSGVLLASGETSAGLRMLGDLRSRLVDVDGPESVKVRNLDRQIARAGDPPPDS